MADRQIKNRVGNAVYEDGDGRLMKWDYATGLYYRLPDFRVPNKSLLKQQSIALKQVNLEVQGQIVKINFTHLVRKQSGGGVRQSITEFSRKSRKAMMERMARIDYSGRVTFITLTYKSDVSHKDAKSHLRAFLKRLRRNHPDENFAAVWRMEYQQRGTIHWHIMCFGLPFTAWKDTREWWREITGQPDITQVRIELIRDHKKARNYVSKYMAKSADYADVLPLLDSMTNQAGKPFIGRFWGIEGRQFLPMAQLIITTITDLYEVAYDFKRYMRRAWRGVNKTGGRGAMIFVDNAEKWLELWRHCILQGE